MGTLKATKVDAQDERTDASKRVWLRRWMPTCIAMVLVASSVACGGAKPLAPSSAYEWSPAPQQGQYPSSPGSLGSPSSPSSRFGTSGNKKAAREGSAPAAEESASLGGARGYESRSRDEWAPPASGSADSSSSVPRPSQRPGLGTEWGETRMSSVHEESFTRADGDTPMATGDFRYDDSSGIRNALGFVSDSARSSATLELAGGAIVVSLRDGTGSELPGVGRGDRTYVIGSAGERYTIALQNRTRYRFEIVATVDGLDVVNGKTGSLSNRGYVLDPYTSFEIEGFRKSENAVAAFRFGRVADSYAAEKGDARNVGVIGVAAFADKNMPRGRWNPWDREFDTRDRANPFPDSPSNDGRFARPPRGR